MSVTHVYKVWLILPTLTHFPHCDSYLYDNFDVLPMFIQCDSFSKVWFFWKNVTHFAQCDSYFKVR